MRFSRSKFWLRCAPLAVLILLSATKAAMPGDSLIIPGGLSLLANAIALDPPLSLERLFSYILSAEFFGGRRDSTVRRDLLSRLSDYGLLLEYLRKKGLAPTDPESGKSEEISFPLAGKTTDIAKTLKLLSFFGIRGQLRAGKGDLSEEIELESRQGWHASEHQDLFLAMGLNLPGRNPREIRICLKSEQVPLLLDEPTWERILQAKNQSLLRRFIENPKAICLYLALAACPQKTREALINLVEPGQLLKSSKALMLFGSDLRFERGTLVLPGSCQAWENLLGIPASGPAPSLRALLTNDGGIPLLLYSSLSAAPVSVQ